MVGDPENSQKETLRFTAKGLIPSDRPDEVQSLLAGRDKELSWRRAIYKVV